MRWFHRRQPNIAKLQRREDVERLVKATTYRRDIMDSEGRLIDLGAPTRRAALTALGELPEAPFRDACLNALDDREEMVRLQGLEVLCQQADAQAALPLIDRMLQWPSDGYERTRREAAATLLSLDHSAACEHYALGLLRASSVPGEGEKDLLLKLAARSSPAQRKHDLLGPLTRALTEDSPEVRDRAIELLSWLAGESADTIITSLGDPRKRLGAIMVLGRLRDPAAITALTGGLRDPDVEIRRASVQALAAIRHPRATEGLLLGSHDADAEVRVLATTGLDELGTVAVVYSVLNTLRPILRPLVRPTLLSVLTENGRRDELEGGRKRRKTGRLSAVRQLASRVREP